MADGKLPPELLQFAVDLGSLPLLSSCRRHPGTDGILILLVRAKGDPGERVRAHPAVIEARAASWESARRFPGNVTPDNWLLLEGFEGVPEGQLTESVKSNRIEMASMELQRVLSAESAAIGVTNMWRHFLEGKVDDAQMIRPLLAVEGFKLPELF